MGVASDPPARLTLVLGGARSGKSAFAERLVLESGLEPVYLATAEPLDQEMANRIAHHRARRDARFQVIEVPLELARAIDHENRAGRILMVDCLTLWLTNLMVAKRDLEDARTGLLAAVAGSSSPLVLVSNEVGQGVVPLDAMSRAFVDHAGRLHQALAPAADAVFLLTAGLAQKLK